MKSLEEIGCGYRCSLITNRDAWGPGPWTAEPDRVDFEHAGFPCFLHRNALGNWCGYVGLPPGHALYGRDCDAPDVEIHGGLTYGHACQGHLCHVPKAGETDARWWFGFDCGHFMDFTPGLHMTARQFRKRRDYEQYRDLAYVRRETESLAEQLMTAGSRENEEGDGREN